MATIIVLQTFGLFFYLLYLWIEFCDIRQQIRKAENNIINAIIKHYAIQNESAKNNE